MKKTLRIASFVLIALAAATLPGCMKKYRVNDPGRHEYYLSVPMVKRDKSVAPLVDENLTVRRIRISPTYNRKNFVREMPGGILNSDPYNLFFVEPDILLTELTRQYLENSGIFATVTDTSTLLKSRYIIEGSVSNLSIDKRTSENAVRLEVNFVLIHVDPQGRTAPVFQGTYNERAAISADTGENIVAAWNETLEVSLKRLAEDLRRQSETWIR